MIYNLVKIYTPLQWRHNRRDSISNDQPRDCLLNRLFRRRSKKTSKLRVTGLCAGNSPGTDEFPAVTNGQLRGKCFHLIMSSCQESCYELCISHQIDLMVAVGLVSDLRYIAFFKSFLCCIIIHIYNIYSFPQKIKSSAINHLTPWVLCFQNRAHFDMRAEDGPVHLSNYQVSATHHDFNYKPTNMVS